MPDDSQPVPQHHARHIIRAALLVGVAHLIFKFAGLLQSVVMGRLIPVDTYEAVYSFAFRGCILGLFFTFEEVVGPVFLPIFVRERDASGERAAWRFASGILSIQSLVLVLLVAALHCFPERIAWLVTLDSWNSVENPEKYKLAVESLRQLAPALIGLSLGTTTYMLLNSYKRFFLAAFGDAAWRLCAIAGVAIGVASGLDNVKMLIVGLVIGSAAKFFTHLVGLRDKLKNLLHGPGFDRRLLREFALLAAPLIVGILFAKVRDLFNNVSALSTVNEAGLIRANEFGKKLVDTFSFIIPYTISIAMFPFFFDMVERKDRKQLANTITQSGRLLLSVILPAACVMAALSPPITRFLFAGGEFGERAVFLTATSVVFYSLSLPAAALEPMLMQAFFANRRTVAITVVGLIFSSVSIAISAVGIVGLKATGATALIIVAAGFAFSRTLKSLALILLMRKSAPVFPLKPTLTFLFTVCVTALLCSATAYAATQAAASALSSSVLTKLAANLPDKLETAAAGAFGGLAAVLIFFLCCFLFQIKEPKTLLQWAMKGKAALGAHTGREKH